MRASIIFALLMTACASLQAQKIDHAKKPQGSGQGTFNDPVIVTVGSMEIIDLGKAIANDVVVGDKNIAVLETGENLHEVHVKFLREGSTVVIIKGEPAANTRAASYRVISNKLFSELVNVGKLLNGMPGITVDAFSGVVRISGELKNPNTVIRDYDRIYRAEKLFTCLNTVTIAESLYEAAAAQMQKEIENLDGVSNIKVRVLNGTFVLEGDTANAAMREKAGALALIFVPPLMNSESIHDGALVLGAKKYSLRNLIQVKERLPASASPKN